MKATLRHSILFCIILLAIAAVNMHQNQITELRASADVRTRFILASQEAGTGIMEICTKTGQIKYADDIASRMFGYAPGKMNGIPMAKVLPAWSELSVPKDIKIALNASKLNPDMPRVAVAQCMAVSSDGAQIDILTRLYLSPSQNGLFASVNRTKDVSWQIMRPTPQPNIQP